MEYLGIKIRSDDPPYVNEFSSKLLNDYYVKDGENISQALARAATAYCFGDYELAQRIYDYAYNGWFMFASPVLSNAPKGRWTSNHTHYATEFWGEGYDRNSCWVGKTNNAMPISCFLLTAPDTIVGQMDTQKEIAALSISGGGIGLHNQIRAASTKAPGPIPYMKVVDSAIGYYRQSVTRRGACAWYMDVSHPDIMEHIRFRVPSGGDSARKADNRSQFHSAVNLTDEFISAVVSDGDFALKCPHSGEIREWVKARKIWEAILETRALTGEPYIFKTDTEKRSTPKTQLDRGLVVNGSNLCVAPETLVLTDNGHIRIDELEGQKVNVWNGEEFSEVTVFKTGENQELVDIEFDYGYSLSCTPYHKFYIQNSYKQSDVKEVRAFELKEGDRLIKFDLPVIEGTLTLDKAYTNGFFTGDGTYYGKNSNLKRIYLYHSKNDLREHIEYDGNWYFQESPNRSVTTANVTGLKDKFFVPDSRYTISSRLQWLSGWLDADGVVVSTQGNISIQASSIEKEFLKEVQMMLQTLGVKSTVSVMHEEAWRDLPLNDGSGLNGKFNCKTCYRLVVNSSALYSLGLLGFETKRLKWDHKMPQRDAGRFVTVKEVQWNGRRDDTYCFTEPKRGMGMFNGILTGQCSEITLPTNDERTAVCCLSSLNLEYYDEWKDTGIVEDLVRFLDNVLQYFIDRAPADLKKAVYSAKQERSIGLGVMGWHYYLQKHGIPFEGGGFGSAVQHTNIIFNSIQQKAINESLSLGRERGECPDMEGTGRRNARLLAIAPTSNNSIILGTSPSVEPISSNAYTHSTRAGTFLVKNKYLEEILKGINDDPKWLEDQWQSIVKNSGSVQHLEYLTDEQKAVYKTAFELDQHWVVEQADQRQKYICQAQSINLFFPAGVDAAYFNSVHLKAIKAEYLKTLYYCRMSREVKVDVVKEIERKALVDWSGDECVACQG